MASSKKRRTNYAAWKLSKPFKTLVTRNAAMTRQEEVKWLVARGKVRNWPGLSKGHAPF